MSTHVNPRRLALVQGSSLREHGTGAAADDLGQVRSYHERTKHRLERYAFGPEALDWSNQPDPFRRFMGSPVVPLPLMADRLVTPWSSLHQPAVLRSHAPTLEAIGLLFELSLGISAWKAYGPDRWALRCNPSSGNLHPTEGYLLSRGVSGLQDGVYHYHSRDHALEQRSVWRADVPSGSAVRVVIGLSSIHWREAWKYGERAFRYCQLDVGHAVGALRYAAAALGWRLHVIESVGWQHIAHRLGLDRIQDFPGAELEEAELLLEAAVDHRERSAESLNENPAELVWTGLANVLDPHPIYHWPVIDEVAEATRPAALNGDPPSPAVPYPPRYFSTGANAAALIRQRRSAQRFDSRFEMSSPKFYELLDALLPRHLPPWDVWCFSPRVHLVLFIHRIEGLAAGLYALPRNTAAGEMLRKDMRSEFDWIKPHGCPDHLPFYRLATGNCEALARTISCHQAIASHSAFALGMLAEFEDVVASAPWRYRQLHWEAGLLGQVIYLEAEALGFRGTGIGCYFDDTFHEVLGLSGTRFQSLYHFTVGFPMTDSRIQTMPPYPGHSLREAAEPSA